MTPIQAHTKVGALPNTIAFSAGRQTANSHKCHRDSTCRTGVPKRMPGTRLRVLLRAKENKDTSHGDDRSHAQREVVQPYVGSRVGSASLFRDTGPTLDALPINRQRRDPFAMSSLFSVLHVPYLCLPCLQLVLSNCFPTVPRGPADGGHSGGAHGKNV